jgi:hypothetical protein
MWVRFKKKKDLKGKKCRIIKKNVKILHLWTVLADMKSDAFASVKMSRQM